MLLTMGVSLYTSRVVLNALGVEDFGVYSVVGGVVSLFIFLNSAMSSATQRFLTFDIGKKDWNNLNRTFNATLIIHIGVAVLILVIAETLGLWFVNHKLNLPSERMDAANFAYQFSILATVISIIQVPYNALIVARERMNVFALLSIVEGILKLLVAYMLYLSSFDKLKTYSFLLFLSGLLISSCYKLYCVRHFKESRIKWDYDASLYRTLIGYSGWNLFGNAAAVAKGQGTNMLLNIFFGATVNAAYGIMMQVQNAVNLFVSNFQIAVNPQIIKLYASAEILEMQKLMFQASKFSYFLLWVLSMPIIFNIDFILAFWLKDPPPFTAIFVVLCLVNLLIECLSRPLITGALATGRIKWYQIIVGAFLFLNLPFSYFAFLLHGEPVVFLYIAIALSLITIVVRLFFLKRMIGLRIGIFVKCVIFPILLLSGFSLMVLFGLYNFVEQPRNFFELAIISFLIVLIGLALIWLVGLEKSEKTVLYSLLVNKLKK